MPIYTIFLNASNFGEDYTIVVFALYFYRINYMPKQII